jgi:hypothetical protein
MSDSAKLKSFTVEVKEAPNGDAVLPLPQDLLDEMEWGEGDVLNWKDNNDGSFTLSKVRETEIVLVETVSTFRIRYAVRVPKGKSEWALDTVTCDNAKELSQEHLTETIVSHRVISEKEYLEIYDKDNAYLFGMDDDKKLEYITDVS